MPKSKLRILHVLRSPVGGLFRHVEDLTRELAARGHDVGLVVDSLTADARTDATLAGLAAAARLGVHKLPIPRILGLQDGSTQMAIGRLVGSLDIDICHGHGAKGGFHARLAKSQRAGMAVLYTPHGGMLHYRKNSLPGRVFHAFERKALKRTDAVIFESGFARQAFEDLVGVPDCPSPIIFNGLQPGEFVPVPARDNAFDFGFVGEMRTLKGVFELLKALVPLVTPSGRPANLVMAGGGPELEAVKARIAGLGLTDRVLLAGVRPAREIFAQCRCLVVPSLAESLPYVVLEATAAQKPVISTRVGGIPEIFGPTADDLVPAGAVEPLRAAMAQALEYPGHALERMRERLDYIAPRFSVESMVNEIETLYRSVLNHG